MNLHPVDLTIIGGYLALVITLGWVLSRRAGKNLDSYFLGGKSIPWYILGVSHGAAGFDLTGTMWFVLMLYCYGMKGVWILWMWPMFAMVFRMMYLGVWIRRSNVLTGAEWMRTRFGTGVSGNLAHISVVVFALIAVVGFLSMAFQGIGKMAQPFFPFDWDTETYGLVIMCVTAGYLVVGGMYSVVLTDLMQYGLLLVSAVFLAFVACGQMSAAQIDAAVPPGWRDLFFGWHLNLDWSAHLAQINQLFEEDHSNLFGLFVMMMLFKGVLVSMAGPPPGYGMQNVLATRSPREAALENGWISVTAFFPRFLLIGSIVILALGPLQEGLVESVGNALEREDLEKLLPVVVETYVPIGLTGLILAGLLAAFMSTFDSTVNAASAYLVNDIYKRYIRPDAAPKTYVWFGYGCSLLVIALGIVFGYLADSIHSVTKFIVSGLFGAYTVPNVLKWHWWRFNGYGFFAGMLSGMLSALSLAGLDKWATAKPSQVQQLADPLRIPIEHLTSLTRLESFPYIIACSGLASVLVCLLTPPDPDEVVDKFYRQVRPWGWWEPVRRRLAAQGSAVEPNRDFRIDAFNCAVGIAWQTTLVTTPLYLVLRDFRGMLWSILALVGTSLVLKFTWYDRLGPGEMHLE